MYQKMNARGDDEGKLCMRRMMLEATSGKTPLFRSTLESSRFLPDTLDLSGTHDTPSTQGSPGIWEKP